MPSPSFCLHCSAPLSERSVDGVPRLACTACSWVLFENPTPVAGVIVRDGARVLLARPPRSTMFILISGFVEAFESVEQAAVREAREETGVDVEVERLLGSYSCRPIGKNQVFVVAVARPVSGALRTSDELAEARWFPLDALRPWPAEWPVAQAFADLLRQEAAARPAIALPRSP